MNITEVLDGRNLDLERIEQDIDDVRREIRDAKITGEEPVTIRELEVELDDLLLQKHSLLDMFESADLTHFHVTIDGSVSFDTDEDPGEFADDVKYGKVTIDGVPVQAVHIEIRAVTSKKLRRTFYVNIKGIVGFPVGTTPGKVEESSVTLIGLPVMVRSFVVQPVMSNKAESWE